MILVPHPGLGTGVELGRACLALLEAGTNLPPLLLLKKMPRLAALRRERRRKKC